MPCVFILQVEKKIVASEADLNRMDFVQCRDVFKMVFEHFCKEVLKITVPAYYSAALAILQGKFLSLQSLRKNSL